MVKILTRQTKNYLVTLKLHIIFFIYKASKPFTFIKKHPNITKGTVVRICWCICLQIKCEKYWPDQDMNETYGSISVTLEKLNYYPDYEVKQLIMDKVVMCTYGNLEIMSVILYHKF